MQRDAYCIIQTHKKQSINRERGEKETNEKYILYVMLRIAYQRIAPHRFAQVNLCERACAFSVDLKCAEAGASSRIRRNARKFMRFHGFASWPGGVGWLQNHKKCVEIKICSKFPNWALGVG